ncbi:hypothetical protein vseg_019971 [Gypsophila vaccaria]
MSKKSELVIIPAPGMGHLVSMLQLAKLLLKRNELILISIHVIQLPIDSTKITSYVESQSRDNPYPTRLSFVILPPLSSNTLPDPASQSFFVEVIELHKPLVKQAVMDRVINGSSGNKLVGFVLDMFCTGMVDIANEFGVPSYLFFTSGTSLLNYVFFIQSLADDHGLQARDIAKKISDPKFESVVSGFKNPLTSKVIPGAIKEEFGCELMLNFAKQFKRMKGILVNSYVELDSFAIQTLENNKELPPVYPVGPILELNREGEFDNEDKKSIMTWLDGQPESSVVFLCFGSMGSFDEEQVKEIANGLDKSGVRFLWTLRKPSSKGKLWDPNVNQTYLEDLPKGFLDRIVNRGKIISWAPQIDVLAHRAVGGFVSHCGWNSTLESLWFGVPIGTWPMYAEQNLNAFYLVTELELAVEIRMDYCMDWNCGKGTVLVNAVEIEEGLKKLLNLDESMKKKVKDISEKGRKALEVGGSSYNWLKRFIEEL